LFRTGFRGDEGEYEIWVRLSDAWVFFSIDPLIDLPPSGAHGPEVVDLILRINEEINYAKFALDGDGDLALSVEIPRAGTGYSHFADALGALAHYADQYRRDFDRAAEPEVRDDT